MTTENRSSNTDPRDLFIRDNPLGLGEKELAKDRTGFADQRTHSDYLTFLAGYEAAQPAEQHQGESSEYPPCDYCGNVPDHHPWHGSGLLSGVENRHIHACDACRGQLPLHPGKHQGEPVAVLYANGSVLTKADCGDSFEIRCKVETPLYTHADSDSLQRSWQAGYDTAWYAKNPAEKRTSVNPADAGELELARKMLRSVQRREKKWALLCGGRNNQIATLRAQLAEQERSARELLRIIGMSVQGSAAYNRAVIAFHDSLSADTKPN